MRRKNLVGTLSVVGVPLLAGFWRGINVAGGSARMSSLCFASAMLEPKAYEEDGVHDDYADDGHG